MIQKHWPVGRHKHVTEVKKPCHCVCVSRDSTCLFTGVLSWTAVTITMGGLSGWRTSVQRTTRPMAQPATDCQVQDQRSQGTQISQQLTPEMRQGRQGKHPLQGQSHMSETGRWAFHAVTRGAGHQIIQVFLANPDNSLACIIWFRRKCCCRSRGPLQLKELLRPHLPAQLPNHRDTPLLRSHRLWIAKTGRETSLELQGERCHIKACLKQSLAAASNSHFVCIS